MSTATKTDPEKWEQAKRDAKARMGGKHSARAMQLATQLYKKRGGGYSGAKPTAKSNSLKKWTKQKWKWSGGSKDKGVYLPSDKVERLKSSKEGKKKLRAAGRKKAKATREGRQYSSHGLAANTSLKKEKVAALSDALEKIAKKSKKKSDARKYLGKGAKRGAGAGALLGGAWGLFEGVGWEKLTQIENAALDDRIKSFDNKKILKASLRGGGKGALRGGLKGAAIGTAIGGAALGIKKLTDKTASVAAGTSLKKEAAINAEAFKRFGKTLAAKLSKLPADEKAALIAGTISPVPGGSIMLPAAYKGSKKATKTLLAAMMKAHLDLVAPGLRAAAKRSNIVRGAKAVSTSTKTAAAPTAAATIPAANTTRSSIMRVAPLNRKPMAAVAAPTNLFKVPPQMLRDVTSMPKVKRPSLQMIGKKLKAKASLGPVAGSMAFKGGKLKSVGIGLKGSLASNIKGNFGVKIPVGGNQKPYFSGGISGRF